jgi:hypothetical protein
MARNPPIAAACGLSHTDPVATACNCDATRTLQPVSSSRRRENRITAPDTAMACVAQHHGQNARTTAEGDKPNAAAGINSTSAVAVARSR